MNTPATRSLAVCGWTPDAAEALAALVNGGRYRAVAVADASGAVLVRARRDTGLPCFQQVRQFLASADYDAVLIAAPSTAQVASIAAARGAELLVLATACDAEAIEAAAESARTHRGRLVLLLPESHDAGIADLERLLGSSPDWRPSYLDITVEGATEVQHTLGVAVAHAGRLAPDLHGLIRASAWVPRDGAGARSITATIDDGDARVSLRARHAPEAFVRIVGDAAAGAFELRLSGHDATFTYTTAAGDRVQYRPEAVDHWAVEIARAAAADDIAAAREQAALIGAIARSILTGDVQTTSCCARPELRLIEGRGRSAPRRHGLRLVVN